jgi:hypothetical protein
VRSNNPLERSNRGRFYSGVREGFRSGRSEGEIRKSLDLSTWDKLERSYVIGRNINRAYLEIEADSFDEKLDIDKLKRAYEGK